MCKGLYWLQNKKTMNKGNKGSSLRGVCEYSQQSDTILGTLCNLDPCRTTDKNLEFSIWSYHEQRTTLGVNREGTTNHLTSDWTFPLNMFWQISRRRGNSSTSTTLAKFQNLTILRLACQPYLCWLCTIEQPFASETDDGVRGTLACLWRWARSWLPKPQRAPHLLTPLPSYAAPNSLRRDNATSFP